MDAWFGNDLGTAIHNELPEIPVPVGAVCPECQKAIAPGDDGLGAAGKFYHRDCFLVLTEPVGF